MQKNSDNSKRKTSGNKRNSKPKNLSPHQETRAKFSETPFKSATELKKAQEEVELATWKRLATYKSFQSYLKQKENEGVRQDFEAGFHCGYQCDEEPSDFKGNAGILRVYKAKEGIQISINEKKPADAVLVSQLASKLSLAFGNLFYEISGLKTANPPPDQLLEKNR